MLETIDLTGAARLLTTARAPETLGAPMESGDIILWSALAIGAAAGVAALLIFLKRSPPIAAAEVVQGQFVLPVPPNVVGPVEMWIRYGVAFPSMTIFSPGSVDTDALHRERSREETAHVSAHDHRRRARRERHRRREGTQHDRERMRRRNFGPCAVSARRASRRRLRARGRVSFARARTGRSAGACSDEEPF